MSLVVRDVISRALRLNGSLAAGASPTATEMADCLIAWNTMKRAMFGTLIGPRLSALAASGTAQQAENGGEYQIPAAAFTLTLPTAPRPGARVGIVDAAFNFGTNACTVARNGQLINGAALNLTLGTNGGGVRLWFRGDTGSWLTEADSASVASAIEFPDPLIAYLPYMLAVVIAPEFQADVTAAVSAGAAEGRMAFVRAYGGRGLAQIDPPIGLPQPAPVQ